MSDSKTPFHNPFGALDALRDTLPAAPAPAEPARPVARRQTPTRAVVRIERTGRKGKEVTVIEQLDLTPIEREAWLKALKAALGCGGGIEGPSLMLQGDQRPRLAKLLAEKGVTKVTLA